MTSMRYLRRILAGILLTSSVLGLAACNTFEGLGRDVEAGGEAISGGANDVEEEIQD